MIGAHTPLNPRPTVTPSKRFHSNHKCNIPFQIQDDKAFASFSKKLIHYPHLNSDGTLKTFYTPISKPVKHNQITPIKHLNWEDFMPSYFQEADKRGSLLTVFCIYQEKKRQAALYSSKDDTWNEKRMMLMKNEDFERIKEAESNAGSRIVSSFTSTESSSRRFKPCINEKKVVKILFKEEEEVQEKPMDLLSTPKSCKKMSIPEAPYKK